MLFWQYTPTMRKRMKPYQLSIFAFVFMATSCFVDSTDVDSSNAVTSSADTITSLSSNEQPSSSLEVNELSSLNEPLGQSSSDEAAIEINSCSIGDTEELSSSILLEDHTESDGESSATLIESSSDEKRESSTTLQVIEYKDEFDVIAITDSSVKYAYIELTCSKGEILDRSFDWEYIYRISNDSLYIDHPSDFECRYDIYVGGGDALDGEWVFAEKVYNPDCENPGQGYAAGETDYKEKLTITDEVLQHTTRAEYSCFAKDAEKFYKKFDDSYTAIGCGGYSLQDSLIKATHYIFPENDEAVRRVYEYGDNVCTTSIPAYTPVEVITSQYCIDIEPKEIAFAECMQVLCTNAYEGEAAHYTGICSSEAVWPF